MHCANGAGPAVHRTILCLDVEGFGRRTNGDQLAIRAGLYRALRRALDDSGVPASSCYCEDRGDGAMILIGPDVPKELVAGPFPARLATLIERHNRGAQPGARIRVRVAVHAGEIHHDDHGVAGTAINKAFRLLSAPPLKDALSASPGVLALITSGWFFEEVVRQNPACGAAAFRPARVAVKEFRERAWMRPPDTWPHADTARHLRLLALHPGAQISVPAAAALLDVPDAEARVLLDGLGLPERAEGRYDVPAPAGEPGLAPRERSAAVRRVLGWYLGTADNARRLLCPDRVTASLTLPDEPDRALPFASTDEAMRWCETERLNLVAAARVAAEEGHHDIAWRLPLALWTFLLLRSPWTDWYEALRTGLASARLLGDDRGVAYALGGLGYASQNRWRFEESAELFTAACKVFSRLGDVRGEAWALHGLGYACRRLQRYREAVGHHRRSVLLAAALGDRRNTGRALTALGYAYAGLADFGSSLDHFEQAHGIALEADERTIGWTLHGLGYAHHGLRRLHTAIAHYERALEVFREFGDRPGQGEALYNLGRAHMQMSRPDAARDCWMRALAIFEDLQHPRPTPRLRSLDPHA
ncbi:tetratricopeptide repeat protein [Actinomadura sp. WMMA1423]|uniref:tetratricopeptide repeat protein n=1 Tax=Actinomadura sp. WMMA1423 TaxID=2591108 RepID=UPI001146BCD1|nr:tetratricopeptide repeat protein [Actinomadura sp. WMMA1423]